MKRTICISILLAAAVCTRAQTVSIGSGASADNISMARSGNQMLVGMDIDVSGMKVKADRETVLTPVLEYGDSSTELPRVRIMGRRKYLYNLRNHTVSASDAYTYRAGKVRNISYSAMVPWEKWMGTAELDMHNSQCGCSCKLSEESAYPLMANREFEPEYIYVQPEAEAVKERHLEGSAFIDFPVNKTVIYPDYRRNSSELAKINSTIDSVRGDDDVTIRGIRLKGYASPEGSYAHNRELAKGRTAALKDYIQQLYHFGEDAIAADYEPEDWAGLRAYVEASGIEGKAGILSLIDKDTDPDVREAEIKAEYPAQYRFLLDNCYPALRHTDYRINYTIRKYADPEEIRRIIAVQPQKLSLNEMYLLAQTMEAGSEEYDEVFETAVRMYPSDPVANLNAANVAMKRGDLASARRRLDNAGDGGEADYARGLLAMLGDDTETAKKFFDSALGKGVEKAGDCLDYLK